MSYDIIINNGLYFDGTGVPGAIRHIGIRDGKVEVLSLSPLEGAGCPEVIDAKGQWLTPGFLEIHSHYDAEVIAAPALKESVRHGVTSVTIGSCSISMVLADAEDCSDLFTRVEAVPREYVLPILQEKKTWRDAAGYRAFYDQLPLGPNVNSFLGHSELRVAVMGLERATSRVKPSEAELARMEQLLEEALNAGCIGLSVMTTRLDKMDGDRAWSSPLPSTFASWKEFSRLFAVLRRRGAVLQGAPNAVTKVNVFAFLWQAHGWFRKPLKCTMLTALDLKSQPLLHRFTRLSGWLANRVLRGHFRWQTLPAPFTLRLEGLNVNAFEEFGAGEILRNIKDPDELYAKVREPAFRALFKKQVKAVLTKGLWHRDFSDCWVTECPDPSLVGKNFKQLGQARGLDAVDAYFELACQYREALKWTTCYGNQREAIMRKLLASPWTHPGFADSGAHLRSIAQYNFPLRFLKYVRDAELAGEPFMELGKAVRRCSGELADFIGVDAGYLRVGDRADLVLIDPAGLDDTLDELHEAPMEVLGLMRVVKRNDAAVALTMINGRIAYRRGLEYPNDLGKAQRYGRFLPARDVSPRMRPARAFEPAPAS
ncbi:amidohydrolase family protein [Pseudomonas chengduensis]|uniref:N-acyl-D-aspartate/D-glutamate deacylase n=1 Tax=Pseudomonas sihuiensis TaxID=1274359 RepID=A0A1H2LD84_9PSED|nr:MULTISPECIES: amidohydrolase family protein [Pseudomonas]MDH0623779.1 amidohydrolase family protein [Pseudomonas chengduensis]MDH1212007.1 amidohydrolase family protein [Pseudomonas chengduensis]MDH1280052.1 amidohydrolase family protein [Pseudomonas chengduensis]MDH1665002.1 amidohydrolase family protein [Pseudomonas chengduensis]MDH1680681.1 amidohydrolase family protein [Pseudomonas chengduensis]